MALSLTDYDIVSTLSSLGGEVRKAEGGSTTTLVDQSISFNNDSLLGSTIVITSGLNRGLSVLVASYAGNTLTFDAIANPIEAGVNYSLLNETYESYILRAEALITEAFKNSGLDIALMLNTAQLKELHVAKTISLICLSKRLDATDDDMYHSNYLAFDEMYKTLFTGLVVDYDTNSDGTISEDEESQELTQVLFAR